MHAPRPSTPCSVREWDQCRTIGHMGPLFVNESATLQRRPLQLVLHLPTWTLYLVAKEVHAALAPWTLPGVQLHPRQPQLISLLAAAGCEPGPTRSPPSSPVPPGFRVMNPVVITAAAAMLSLRQVQRGLHQKLQDAEAARQARLRARGPAGVLAPKTRVAAGALNLIRDTQRCVDDTLAVLARVAMPNLGQVLAREWGYPTEAHPGLGPGPGPGSARAGEWVEFDWSGYFGYPDPNLTMGVCIKHSPKWCPLPMINPVAMPLVWGPQPQARAKPRAAGESVPDSSPGSGAEAEAEAGPGPGPGPYLDLARVCAAAASVGGVSSERLAGAMAAGGVGPATATANGLWPLLRIGELAAAMAPTGVTLQCDLVSTLAAAAHMAPPAEFAQALGRLVRQAPTQHHAAFFVAATARFAAGKPLGPWARATV